ncbi:TIGR00255 family protein [Verrucomicrobium sp. GAS474]|uniref:YicC/YloC family endoribonuclease n=1 Tax=Verrucomicrobium sp. GAS474 TaxID=1882831 RepID=UPI000879734A|nr:YicC/YloC family endoribonuclease [Verrucomicrobium sp. GAS474]SDU14999.1 TIGR00255 family protein [Verrucomicrobium sp. GAS474]
MKSMTGHGRAVGGPAPDGRRIVVELQSVNRKQIEVVCSLPRFLAFAEAPLREAVSGAIARGRVTLSVSFASADGKKKGAAPVLDKAAALLWHKELDALRKKMGLKAEVPLDLVMRGPGIFLDAETEALPDETAQKAWLAVLEKTTKGALAAFDRMRLAEGDHLAADLLKRIREMEAIVKKIAKRAPHVVTAYAAALRVRIAALGLTLADNDERLAKEVVLHADRCDITEELTRLSSHFAQFRAFLEGAEAAGRSLDFLAQELNREINTIGSKANDVEIAHQVVALKSALEKVREQIQNFE